MARGLSSIVTEQQKLLEAQKNSSKAVADKLYDNKAQVIKDTYTQQIADSEADYEDAHRENAVQKKVNEFYIAEEMANMGLTNSGINRTQMTANQLSYANNKAEITWKRQSMVDALTREMQSMSVENENARLSAMQGIDDSYTQLATENAQKIYASEVEADTERYKASLEASKNKSSESGSSEETPLLYTFQGVSKSNNGYNTFLDSNGKTRDVQIGYNPYTGTNNKINYAAEAKDKNIGFFSNGYQPRGLVSEGGRFSKVTLGGQVVQYNYKGKPQNLWYSPNGNYFLWDGSANQYVNIPAEQVAQIKSLYS